MFTGFHRLQTAIFHLHRTQDYGMSLCVSLTIAIVLTHGRRTGSVRNPCPFRWGRTPWPPTSSARLPRRYFRRLDLCGKQSSLPIFAFDLSALNSRRPHCSSRIQAFALSEHLGESSLAACYGMHATPDFLASQSLPTARPSCIGTPWIHQA